MLDLKWVRAHPEQVREALRRRHQDETVLNELLAKDEAWRADLAAVEQLKAERNKASEQIARGRKQGEDVTAQIERMRQVSDQISALDGKVRQLESAVRDLLLAIPNIPHASVPEGRDDRDNVEVRRWGEPRTFEFTPLAHWDLGVQLGILDSERAAKVAGARFTFVKGWGARLQRALTNFMLDLHVKEHGYLEVLPPFLVNRESMIGTGQLPKFAEEMFKVEKQDLYLIPTAEVPVTNIHRDEILSTADLPLYYVGYSSCFRAEAGAYGRDTRGLIRMHQFEKVELVKFVLPQTSYDELEKLVNDAEAVLQRLELPYRVVCLSTGDLTFSSAKTYDLEVWMPSYGRYVEISSCSNFEDYQARRANIRYRPEGGGKLEFVHTLNGSGLAIGRTVAAVLENYQRADGTIQVPLALRPYMDGIEAFPPRGLQG
ncbi:MAG: serine--tRNA ligase [Limnochordaceae bacterium]|nr:serine--tRNA ligase [Limnochordaceae bacterium]